MSDYRHVAAWLPSRHQVAARMSAGAGVDHRGERLDDVAVEGWTANVAEVRAIRLEAGRLFTPLEVDRSHPVCVIGGDVVDKLFGDRPALGAFLRIGGRHARVIGILEREPGFLGQSPNRRVLIPITLFAKAVSTRPSLTLSIRASTAEEIPEEIDAVTAAMRVQHRLRPDEEDDFAVMTSEMLLDLWGRITGSIFAALVGLVSVSLVVGGIVIMNTMLVSVTERTREVGLRKALGARRRDITWQFLCEALALSITGGVIGILLGFSVARAVSLWTPLPYAVETWSVLAGLSVTAGVGLIFGIYPANRAARLSPVEALRFE
jgi:putative ABC transport system permease protein